MILSRVLHHREEGKQAVFLGGERSRGHVPELSSGSGTSYTQCSGLP